jgi:inosine-uridine nucleoside N-ribohydrolase
VRVWIDTDVGDNPDDAIALWCARQAPDIDVIGVSTVDGDVDARAVRARELVPGVPVVAGRPPTDAMNAVDVLIGIGPWTNVARLAELGALPGRVVLMGGVIGTIRHRGELRTIEQNVERDPRAAAELVHLAEHLTIVPLNVTAFLSVPEPDEELYATHIPGLREEAAAWRARVDGAGPIVLHDPAALFVARGDGRPRLETRRLRVRPDGSMQAAVDGPIQNVVAHLDTDAIRARVRALVSEGD